MILKEYNDWVQKLSKIQLPSWDELPSMDLYIDQLVSFVNDRTASLNVGRITKSMVNNYVKKGIIIAPVKKKYSAYQVAAVTVVALLKNTYPIDSIKETIDQMTVNNYPKAVYNRFVELYNARLRGESAVSDNQLVKENEKMLNLVVSIAYQRMLAVQLLKTMQDNQEPVVPRK